MHGEIKKMVVKIIKVLTVTEGKLKPLEELTEMWKNLTVENRKVASKSLYQ